MLTLLIAIPIVAAILILLGLPAKKTAIASAALNLIITLAALWQFQPNGDKFQFLFSWMLMPEWKLAFFVGADGLSLLMLLLTALVTLAAVWVAPTAEKLERWPATYYACLLFIAAGATGAFASLDLFFFYAFHEVALIPTFLLIGIWGSGDRAAAAWKITIYLALGSFILLIGLVAFYLGLPAAVRTFSIPELQASAIAHLIPQTAQTPWIYLCILIGFGILVSLFPFHSWAAPAYASAPAPAAMLHAGVLKKFGLYGMLRVALPLMPQAAQHWTNLLLLLLVGNILYIGLVTIAQKRLDWMLGYSSVMHMGYIFLGIAAFNRPGLSGAALLMFAHGLSIAILFAIAGAVRQRTSTLEFVQLGGLAKPLPFLGFTFGLAAFAAIGLPGFGNFAAEIPIYFGAFAHGSKMAFLSPFRLASIVALWGVVISAVYMLRGYRAVFLGETNKRWAALTDVCQRIRVPVILLLAVLILAGFRPQIFLNLVNPTVTTILSANAK